MRIEDSPSADSNANGSSENAIKQIEAQLRALKMALDSGYIPRNLACMPWLTTHAASA